ncbi:general odorant-binding protein 68-like [Pararge aegeria]|uniref:Jg7203 protein n=1 Tax=Pararge aegeria aegeria TaxID=348720 RepID=A0A8S4R7Y8_9NEOP|nr:general odorant-binding protein 68-like [Pararge aegeria]CAH2231791.1 jg7203 [Pararge aegeria aegeria]
MVAMSFLSGLLFIVISSVYAGDEDAMMSCLELFNPEGIEKMCCENFESFENINKDYEECLKEDSEEWMCEDFQCILKKSGVMQGDTIDEDGAKKFYDTLEKDYPKEKSLIERARRECLDDKYQSYPPEDSCPAVKFYICNYINAYLECDSWKKLDVCTEMAENAKKCKKTLDG